MSMSSIIGLLQLHRLTTLVNPIFRSASDGQNNKGSIQRDEPSKNCSNFKKTKDYI